MTYKVVLAFDADNFGEYTTPGKFYVCDSNGNIVEGPFDSEDAALAWIRENEAPRPKG
jgi:hypothetical protein